MIHTILLPTDGSDITEPALKAAMEWLKQVNGKLVVLSVARTLHYNPLSENVPSTDWKAYEEEQRRRSNQILDQVRIIAEQSGVHCETVLEQSDDPAEKIILTAKSHHCDAIFMTAHRRPRLTRLFIGSQTQKVLAHSDLPVMVFH